MGSLLKEVQLAVRSFRHQPLVTGIILVTLGLSLASNAVAFGLIDRMVLRPFSIPNVDRLVLVSEHPVDALNMRRSGVAVSRFLDWREQAAALTQVVGFSSWSANFAGGDEPERIDGQRVSSGFFDLLGATMALGRPIQAGDEPTGQHRRVVFERCPVASAFCRRSRHRRPADSSEWGQLRRHRRRCPTIRFSGGSAILGRA